MGLFDLFKKKDAAFYLNRAQKALEQKRWVDARDDLQEGLSRADATPELKDALHEAMRRAQHGIYLLNLQEADHCQATGDFARALECLETARLHTMEPSERQHVEALATAVRQARAEARKPVEVLQPGQLPSYQEEEDALDEEFEAHLSGLMPDVAELYKTLGPDFVDAYLALNAGEPERALHLFQALEPHSDDSAALLAFEQARALLMLQHPDQALLLLDVAASIRGAAPIFLSDHPSIAYLRFEALAMLDRLEDAAQALREGLAARPDHPELRQTLASALIALHRLEEAEPLLRAELACSRSNPQVHVLRARLLLERGDSAAAAATLEDGIKSCGCSPASLPHPLLARSLADIYLNRQEQPRRVETLLNQLFRAQEGEAEWIDYFLKARYLKWQGNEELARASWRQALQQLPEPGDPRRTQVERLFSSGG